MTDPATLKKQLRRQALARRDALADSVRVDAALTLADRAALLGPVSGLVVSGFLPIRSEIDLRPLMAALAGQGARLCLPAILDRETIVFRDLVRGAPLVDMGFGTVGPGPEAEVLDPALMLVPLAAFDRSGQRIGYGGGYYDRAIARLQARGLAPRLVGVGFDCQEVDAVPAEPHDRPLHAILTESGLRSFAAGA